MKQATPHLDEKMHLNVGGFSRNRSPSELEEFLEVFLMNRNDFL